MYQNSAPLHVLIVFLTLAVLEYVGFSKMFQSWDFTQEDEDEILLRCGTYDWSIFFTPSSPDSLFVVDSVPGLWCEHSSMIPALLFILCVIERNKKGRIWNNAVPTKKLLPRTRRIEIHWKSFRGLETSMGCIVNFWYTQRQRWLTKSYVSLLVNLGVGEMFNIYIYSYKIISKPFCSFAPVFIWDLV